MKTRLLFISLIGILLCFVVLHNIDSKLQSGNAEYGIVSFELAHHTDTADKIVGHWTENNNLNLAIFSLGFDYAFILFYVAFLAFWTSLMAETFYKMLWRNLAFAIISIFVLAGILDFMENYSLMNFLAGADTEYWINLAFYCSSIKFSLLGIGVLYNLVVFVGRRFSRI